MNSEGIEKSEWIKAIEDQAKYQTTHNSNTASSETPDVSDVHIYEGKSKKSHSYHPKHSSTTLKSSEYVLYPTQAFQSPPHVYSPYIQTYGAQNTSPHVQLGIHTHDISPRHFQPSPSHSVGFASHATPMAVGHGFSTQYQPIFYPGAPIEFPDLKQPKSPVYYQNQVKHERTSEHGSKKEHHHSSRHAHQKKPVSSEPFSYSTPISSHPKTTSALSSASKRSRKAKHFMEDSSQDDSADSVKMSIVSEKSLKGDNEHISLKNVHKSPDKSMKFKDYCPDSGSQSEKKQEQNGDLVSTSDLIAPTFVSVDIPTKISSSPRVTELQQLKADHKALLHTHSLLEMTVEELKSSVETITKEKTGIQAELVNAKSTIKSLENQKRIETEMKHLKEQHARESLQSQRELAQARREVKELTKVIEDKKWASICSEKKSKVVEFGIKPELDTGSRKGVKDHDSSSLPNQSSQRSIEIGRKSGIGQNWSVSDGSPTSQQLFIQPDLTIDHPIPQSQSDTREKNESSKSHVHRYVRDEGESREKQWKRRLEFEKFMYKQRQLMGDKEDSSHKYIEDSCSRFDHELKFEDKSEYEEVSDRQRKRSMPDARDDKYHPEPRHYIPPYISERQQEQDFSKFLEAESREKDTFMKQMDMMAGRTSRDRLPRKSHETPRSSQVQESSSIDDKRKREGEVRDSHSPLKNSPNNVYSSHEMPPIATEVDFFDIRRRLGEAQAQLSQFQLEKKRLMEEYDRLCSSQIKKRRDIERKHALNESIEIFSHRVATYKALVKDLEDMLS
ncbi:hypothetical protein ADUPG1_012981 [Aduncisulcus paluster]|uniref:PH domain-containing protein n=1 Tax=Aduncisulcus paluster TaxID=2918883 RepID=A0ABQ5K3C0_9EUKA|nr:hypothetical protein ADUPG1_012981 [Aduncisulcus paluster]